MPIKREKETGCRNRVGRSRHNVSCKDVSPTLDQQLDRQPLERFESKYIDDKLKFVELMLEILSYFVDDDIDTSEQHIIEPNDFNSNADLSFFNDNICNFQNDLLTSSVYSATKLQSTDDIFLSDTIRIKPKNDT